MWTHRMILIGGVIERWYAADPLVRGIRRNVDEGSQSGRAGNSRRSRRVVNFWQHGGPDLHCVVLFASARLCEPIRSSTHYIDSSGGVDE
jgi:hypothetical protein